MEIELVLNTKVASDEITELNDFIREHNLKGIMTKVVESKPKPGEMGAGEYMQIIELILGSTVVAAGVKGLFDIFKNYFDLKKQTIKARSEIEKAKIEQHKISLKVKTKDGNEVNLEFGSFDEKEREKFFKTVDKIF